MKMEQAKRLEEDLDFRNVPQKYRFWLTNLVRFHRLRLARTESEICYIRKMSGIDFFGEPLYIGLHLGERELIISTFLETQKEKEESEEEKTYDLVSDLENASFDEDFHQFQKSLREIDNTLGKYSGCKAFL